MNATEIQAALHDLADPDIAVHSQRFFKTGPGEYGEGDRFLGVRVPALRAEARRHGALPLAEVRKLLHSSYHEIRLLALLVLVHQYAKADETGRESIYTLYLDNTERVNNWDLVDCSAHAIAGAHLNGRSREPLHRLSRSANLWERRIAIIATLYFIRQHDFRDTLTITHRLLHDSEDLIHKAAGWMLREVGKRDVGTLKEFLARHYRRMPRTELRYAIERLPEPERQAYLRGTA